MTPHQASERGSVLVVTALPSEFRAIRAHLTDVSEHVDRHGTVYDRGSYRGWVVWVLEAGAGNPGAAAHVERGLEFAEPDVALLVGVAGGVKDVSIGDVVAATTIYGYDSAKDTAGGAKPRPGIATSSYRMVQRARAIGRRDEWASNSPKAFVAPIATGEKVVGSVRSATAKLIRKHYSNVLAVEMEAIGFHRALDARPAIESLVVRGISDLLSGKRAADEGGSQELAARRAAEFAFQVLGELTVATARRRDASRSQVEQLLRDANDTGVPLSKTLVGVLRFAEGEPKSELYVFARNELRGYGEFPPGDIREAGRPAHRTITAYVSPDGIDPGYIAFGGSMAAALHQMEANTAQFRKLQFLKPGPIVELEEFASRVHPDKDQLLHWTMPARDMSDDFAKFDLTLHCYASPEQFGRVLTRVRHELVRLIMEHPSP